ncbi:site-2 protease family protein [archaeon]|nr:site-2 protease family protein [archaeon]
MEPIILLTILFLISLVLFVKRKKFSFYGKFPFFYFGMYKTKIGIKLMDDIVKKHSTILKTLGQISIVIGFLGMIIMSYDMIKTIYRIIFTSYTGISVGLVLPIKAKGVFYVPIVYWIIVLAFLAIVHEFAHGVIARLYKIRVKSTGIAILGVILPIIPAAFVEPDEKRLEKKKLKEQLAVFAAGPFINLVFGLIFLVIFYQLMTPLSQEMYNYQGLEITKLFGGNTPAKVAGLQVGEVIKKINGEEITSASMFKEKFNNKKEGDLIQVTTGNAVYDISLGNNGMLGVFVEEKKELINKVWYTHLFEWIKDLIYWLFVLNLGVGLFNLIPIGPIDGGRMLHAVLQKIMPHKQARRIWYGVSFVFLFSILGSLLVSFI